MNDMSLSSPSTPEPVRIEYVPRQGLLSLSLVNFVLGLLTLTIYRFWGKTNVRKHIWSCVHINGHPLEYTGRGIELFKGALIVFLVFALPVVLLFTGLSFAYGPEHPAVAGVQVLVFLIVSLLWGAAIYKARRYQLSRTLWRGIRGALVGSATTYSLTFFGAMLARGVSLGWTTPVMNLNLQQQIIGDMRFGDQPFRFKGRAGPLYPTYALCWFLTIAAIIGLIVLITAEVGVLFGSEYMQAFFDFFVDPDSANEDTATKVGIIIFSLVAIYLVFMAIYPIIWSFYTARELSTFASYTSFGDAAFRLDATAGSIIRLVIGNLLLTIFTLGIATPYVQQRLIRYLCDRLHVSGTVDVDRIRQSQAAIDPTGEGLADALDIGGI